MSVELIIDSLFASKIEISIAKIRTAAEYQERRDSALAEADKQITKIWDWSQKPNSADTLKDIRLATLKGWKAALELEPVKTKVDKLLEKFNTIYGVKNAQIFRDDATGMKKYLAAIAKMLHAKYKAANAQAEGAGADSDDSDD